jgi:hypothetical protein
VRLRLAKGSPDFAHQNLPENKRKKSLSREGPSHFLGFQEARNEFIQGMIGLWLH